jgi:hypothetical protein
MPRVLSVEANGVPVQEADACSRRGFSSASMTALTISLASSGLGSSSSEPGGVLFEIATDVPGFTVDEPQAALPR